MNTAEFLDWTGQVRPESIAVVDDGRRYTYGEVLCFANQIANGLASKGYGPGDKIAICCPNRIGFILAYYGILKIGATAVVLSTGLRPKDLFAQIRDSGTVALFCFDGYGDFAFVETVLNARQDLGHCRDIWIIPSDPLNGALRDAPSLSDLARAERTEFQTISVPDHRTAIIPYTSGTTGNPKGVEISHGNISAMIMLNRPLASWDSGRVRLVATPLFHILAQISGLVFPVSNGQTIVLMERFDPHRAWHLIKSERITYLAGPPSLFKSLLDNATADSFSAKRHLQLCGTGASPLPESWSHEFQARFGTPLLPGYGATETTSAVSWNCPTDRLKPKSVGRPIPGVHVRIVDGNGWDQPAECEGRILVRSPGNMTGYLNRSEATAKVLKDGWYDTGDLGAVDADGYLTWLGRADEIIVRWTGTNTSPSQIENVILSHPYVSQAAVFGVEDNDSRRRVVAMLAPKVGSSIEEQSFRKWLANEIPDNLMPDRIEIRASLPLTETGKVARHLLKA